MPDYKQNVDHCDQYNSSLVFITFSFAIVRLTECIVPQQTGIYSLSSSIQK